MLTVAVFTREHIRDEAQQATLVQVGDDVCAREASARVKYIG